MSIEAMKQVVKEAVYHRGGYWIIPEKDFSSLCQAIAEAEKDEPVAGTYWACERCNFACDKDECCPECGHPILVQHEFHPQPKREHDIQDVRCECCGYMTHHREHLSCIRAAQPKRKPLTDKDIAYIAIHSQQGISPHDDALRFARAIEAAHGITSDMKQEHVDKTAKQQHEWVGLTDDEIDQGLCYTPYAMKTAEAWREGVRWAHHQLKEKNT
jgi:hypothetical protein